VCCVGITLWRLAYCIQQHKDNKTNFPWLVMNEQSLESFKNTGTVLTIQDQDGLVQPYHGATPGEALISYVLYRVLSIQDYSKAMTIFNFCYNAGALLVFSLLLFFKSRGAGPVSYTHLTLPTIYSV